MGGAESKAPCKHPLNPDILSVVTLSDSAVQRLPLASEDSPLDKEQRNQNIDDYWRDRLNCLERAYEESNKITEKEFSRLEFALKKMTPDTGKTLCSYVLGDIENCYLANVGQSLNCTHIVDKLQLCLDTQLQDISKKRHQQALRRAKKKKC